MTRRCARPAFVLVLLLAVIGCGSNAEADGGHTLGPGQATVHLGIHHSRFSQDRIVVRAGTTLRFVLTNDDPILHELVTGPPDVHRRHAGGVEAEHPPVPGEVTVQPLSSAETVYDFAVPGTFEFTCHLPGHRAYGMTGAVVVTAA